MAIDAAMPVSREIALSSTVPQASLTRRDRELQLAEGRPPIEVSDAELEACTGAGVRNCGKTGKSDERDRPETRHWTRQRVRANGTPQPITRQRTLLRQ